MSATKVELSNAEKTTMLIYGIILSISFTVIFIVAIHNVIRYVRKIEEKASKKFIQVFYGFVCTLCLLVVA